MVQKWLRRRAAGGVRLARKEPFSASPFCGGTPDPNDGHEVPGLLGDGLDLSGPKSQSQRITKNVDFRSQSITAYNHKKSQDHNKTVIAGEESPSEDISMSFLSV